MFGRCFGGGSPGIGGKVATVGGNEACGGAQGQMGAGPVLSGGLSAVRDGGSVTGDSALRGKQRRRSEGGC